MEATVAPRVAAVAATSIVSPLGLTTAENYLAVTAGGRDLQLCDGLWGLPQPFLASLTDRTLVAGACSRQGIDGAYTYFELMALLSIASAAREAGADLRSPRTLLVIATTKGNVDLLRQPVAGVPADRVLPGVAAAAIARHFGCPNAPLVVSNACTSGLCAQIEAMRLVRGGWADTVVVCGADVLSPFVVSGFQSLMALSAAPCRPFDEDRTGINLGEAAATIVYKAMDPSSVPPGTWTACRGAIRNDAYHISSPSRTGEGCYRALRHVVGTLPADRLAFVSAHGTGTLFNDEMEAVAVSRAGLTAVPLTSLKGYYGHTMGAAGVVETIVSMAAADDSLVPATKGFSALGVSRRVSVSSRPVPTSGRAFVKMLSGFGGCNAAMLFSKV